MDFAQHHPVLREYLFHSPNGGSRNIIEARKLKRMGVKKGLSDLFLAYPSQGYHGFFIELKRKGLDLRSVSIYQSQWLEKVKKVGYKGSVAFGADEAINLLKKYLS